MPAHKHAAVIKAWADGAEIQWRHPHLTDWLDHHGGTPTWSELREYRVKPVPHKWQKEMDAFAAGKTIQFFDRGRWCDWKPHTYVNQRPTFSEPAWNLGDEYRIKPARVVKRYFFTEDSMRACSLSDNANVELVFEDGALIESKVVVK